MKFLTLLIILSVLGCPLLYGQYSGGAHVANVNYQNVGDNIVITYDLVDCTRGSYYYYAYVSFEDAETKIRRSPSAGAVSGTGREAPVTCRDNLAIVWDFSREPQNKRILGAGEFVVEVFEVPRSEIGIVTRIGRVDERLLRAAARGKDGRVRRLERRRQRMINRQIRRHGY